MNAFKTQDLTQLLAALTRADALGPWLSVLAGLAVAALLVRWIRGHSGRPGILLGDGTFDGALFPLLSWALVWAASWTWSQAEPGRGSAVFHIALPVLLSLAWIRLGVRILNQVFPHSRSVRLAERWFSWMVWLALVLWITGLGPVVLAQLDTLHWRMGGVDVTVRSLLEGAITAVVVLLLALWASAALEAKLLQENSLAGVDLSMRKIAANGIRALLVFVGVLMALSAAGIPLGALGVMGGAIGVGIGFGLQKLAANYVSGFVILAERALRIGDMISVDGFEGRITDIHTRYTVVRALNGREAVIPNEMLITQRVVNASLTDPVVVMNGLVQVPYGTDLEFLIPELKKVIAQVPRVLAEPAPHVALSNFAPDGLELTLAYWIGDPQHGDLGVRGDVNLAVLKRLTELGVPIPYPQRVVHSRAP